eukprot:1559432-Pyramimonas_sp.AAC.1
MSYPRTWKVIEEVRGPARPVPFHLDERLGPARSLSDEKRDLADQCLVIALYLYNSACHSDVSHSPL